MHGVLFLATLAPTQAQETPLPAGRTGSLAIDIEVTGQRGGDALDRRMQLRLAMVSSETVGMDILGNEADEDMQAAAAHQAELGTLVQSGEADMLAAANALQSMLSACAAGEESPGCLAAKRSYEAANARVNALGDAVASKGAQAPAPTGAHRYQQWMTSVDRGCGTIHAVLREGRSTVEASLPAGDSVDEKLVACGSTFVLDRRAQRITLVVNPVTIRLPAGGDFLDLVDLDESPGAETDHMAESLTLRNQPIEGAADHFTGRKAYRSERGVVTTVSWTFTAD